MTRSPRRLKEQVRETVSELPIHAARLAVMGVGQALLLTDRVRKDYKEARESGIGPVVGRLRNDAENLTGRLVGMVAGRAPAEEGARADGRGTARAASSEIAVGKPSAAGRTRPAGGPAKPSTAAPKKRSTATGRSTTAQTKGSSAAARRTETAAPGAKASPEETATRTAPGDGGTAPGAVAESAVKAAATAEADRPAAPAAEGPAAPTPPADEAAAPRSTTEAAPQAGSGPVPATELPVPGYDTASIASVRARLRNLSTRQVNELRDYERAHEARAEFLRMYENRIAKLRAGG